MIYYTVTSSNIEAVGHSGHSGTTMHVTFKNGNTYEYHGVSFEQFQELKNAESVGKHLHGMKLTGKKMEAAQ